MTPTSARACGWTLEFEKMHGLGNDFVLVRADLCERLRAVAGLPDYPRLARLLCDRRFGVGADGLLVVGLGSDAAPETCVTMGFFNPDGSESAMCGNGVRCVAYYAVRQELSPPGPDGRLPIRTGAGVVVTWVRELTSPTSAMVEVDMGMPRLAPEAIPTVLQPNRTATVPGQGETAVILDRELGTTHVSCVSMGNPHAVVVVQQKQDLPHGRDLEALGGAIQSSGAFPQGTNVEFCYVEGPRDAHVTVLERGAGITLACGSGACASAVALHLLGLVESDARVHLPGGTLRIKWDQNTGHVHMTGPVTHVFSGAIHDIADIGALQRDGDCGGGSPLR